MKTKITLAALFAPLLAACGPSPTAVCDHMIELAKAEEGGEAIAKKAEEGRSQCIDSMTTAKDMQGSVKFNEKANCIMDAKTFGDAMKCQE